MGPGSNCSESMGEHLRGGPSFVIPNKPEQITPLNCSDSPNDAPTDIRPLPARPSAMMPDHQPPGHGVLAQAVMLPDSAGTKWHQMALFKKIRIWDRATSYKNG